jgi:hypothetical protein
MQKKKEKKKEKKRKTKTTLALSGLHILPWRAAVLLSIW